MSKRRTSSFAWWDRACLTLSETEACSGLGNNKILDLIAEGTLRSVKVGNRRLVYADSLLEFLGLQRGVNGLVPAEPTERGMPGRRRREQGGEPLAS
jgi:excisionase family DNA binding protein